MPTDDAPQSRTVNERGSAAAGGGEDLPAEVRVAVSGLADGRESASIAALQLFARYDSLRLQTYQERECHGERIRILRIGSATALRFDDVGYFNRVYAPDQSIAERLAEVEAFYRGCPFGCELLGPSGAPVNPIERACRLRGWIAGGRYAWLHVPTAMAMAPPIADEFTIRQPEVEERTLFLLTYLQGFEAQPDRFAAALKNMRHLFEIPELLFLMAWKENRPAGVGMMYQVDETAALCAGATLPQHRRQACHAALLRARIQFAIQRGSKEIFSWATDGGQSQANMERAGLRTVGVTSAWHFRASRG
jgi:hypothetical protein